VQLIFNITAVYLCRVVYPLSYFEECWPFAPSGGPCLHFLGLGSQMDVSVVCLHI